MNLHSARTLSLCRKWLPWVLFSQQLDKISLIKKYFEACVSICVCALIMTRRAIKG